MKNIQLIDGALNCTYDVFSISDDDFALLFPLPERDLAARTAERLCCVDNVHTAR